MAVIAFANIKGGAGKTTAALVLAMDLARRGQRIVILDADPVARLSHWFPFARPSDRLQVLSGVTTQELVQRLQRLRGAVDHVLVDLSGASDAMVALAAGVCDLLLVPVQGSAPDAWGASCVLDIVNQVETAAARPVNHAILLNRVHPLVTRRAMLRVHDVLAPSGVEVLATPLVERAAFREIFEAGHALYGRSDRGSDAVQKAQRNAVAFGDSVLARLGIAVATAPVRGVSAGSLPRAGMSRSPAGFAPITAYVTSAT